MISALLIGSVLTLAPTAERVEATMERFLDAEGLLMSHLDGDYRPFVGDAPPGEENLVMPGADCTQGDFTNYENTGMTQGSFLAAMCAKFRATGLSEALAKARRTYRGIRRVYEMSQRGGKGFYCKPWGGRYQDETSSDQYVYTLAGLAAYERIVRDEAERREVREMVVAMCDFWRTRDYAYKYYAAPLQWQRCRFVSFAALASRFETGTANADELKRLLVDPTVLTDIPFGAYVAKGRGGPVAGGTLYGVNGENALSGFLSVGAALENDPSCAYAQNVLQDFYELATLSLAGDGTCYRFVVRSPDGTFAEMDPKLSVIRRPAAKPPRDWLFFGVRAPFRYGGQHSALAVNALVQMAPYHRPSADWVAQSAARHLAAIADGHFTLVEDPHDVLPPTLKWLTRMKSGDAVANWLWAYWTLRMRDKIADAERK